MDKNKFIIEQVYNGKAYDSGYLYLTNDNTVKSIPKFTDDANLAWDAAVKVLKNPTIKYEQGNIRISDDFDEDLETFVRSYKDLTLSQALVETIVDYLKGRV